MRCITAFFIVLIVQFKNVVAEVNTSAEKVIPSLSNEPIGVSNYIQMFFGLFIVVFLIVAVAWFMRRMGGVGGLATSNLKVIGGISVGQRERVVLIQAGNTQLLVGVAPGTVRAIHVLDEPVSFQTELKQENSKTTSGFAEKLHAAIKNRSNT